MNQDNQNNMNNQNFQNNQNNMNNQNFQNNQSNMNNQNFQNVQGNPNLNNQNYDVNPTNANELPEQPNNGNSKLIIIFLVIILVLVGIISYLIVKDKIKNNNQGNPGSEVAPNGSDTETPENGENSSSGKAENSEFYTYQELNTYTIYNISTSKETTKLVYKYPVINIKGNYAEKVNKELKEKIEEFQKNFESHDALTSGCTDINESMVEAYILLNSSKKLVSYYNNLKFEIKDNGSYLTIIASEDLKSLGAQFCDQMNESYVYSIDKTTGEEVTAEEILTNAGYNYDDVFYKFVREYYIADGSLGTNPTLEDLKNYEYINDIKMKVVVNSSFIELYGNSIYSDQCLHFKYSKDAKNLECIMEE